MLSNIYKYGIIHFKGNILQQKLYGMKQKICDIFFLEFIYDFTKNNNKEKNLITEQSFYIYNRYNFNTFNNDSNSIYIWIELNKYIKCK